MLKILTVMKSGGVYSEDHVIKIMHMVNKHVTIPYQFLCLSDISSEHYITIPLIDNLPGWFSKLEIFKIAGPCLFLDLDTIIINNIDEILMSIKNIDADLISLNDVYLKQDFIQSSILYWNHNLNIIYDIFINNQELYTNNSFIFDGIEQKQSLSDQNIIYKICKQQKINNIFFPQQGSSIVSFKADILNINNKDTINFNKYNIIYFHGQPRPWEQNIIKY